MGTLVLNINKVPLSARKPVNINVSGSASPKLAFVTASCSNCDVEKSYIYVCAKFHLD